jgi:hypothetical protein
MSNCIDTLKLENIEYCPNAENQPGLSEVELYYTRLSAVNALTLPLLTAASTLEERMKISAVISFNVGGRFAKIQAMVDENELESKLVGKKGNKKWQTMADLFIPGTSPKQLGFMDGYKNEPMVFVVKNRDGDTLIIGTKNNPAYIEDASYKSGKAGEDNVGTTLKISANSKVYFYSAAIQIEPTPVIP